jgi:glutamine kinase
MKRDFAIIPRLEFLMRYGHLRPGTYDILSRRYDEAPDQYFSWSARAGLELEPVFNDAFVLSPARLRQIDTLLAEHGLECSALEMLRFIKDIIEAREMAKFVFTRTLSDALAMFADFGREYGFSIEDCAHAEIDVIRDLYLSRGNPAKVLGESIERGYRRYHVCRRIVLPPLIEEASQAWSFQLPPAAPNYITQKRAIGTVASVSDGLHALPRSILMITSADPGYDWIFSHPIAGFITMYGGINSHMSIRAAELGLPAVIGAGETLFNSWRRAMVLEIDCANQNVMVVR